MQPQISGAPSCSSTGPVFWSYSYGNGTLPPATEKGLMASDDSPRIVHEPVDTEHLNRLVAAAMYASIKQSMPYIMQTQYNWKPESGPFYLQQGEQQQSMSSSLSPPSLSVHTPRETSKEIKTQRQRQRRGCC